jgi:hypothetical protein
MLRRASVNSFGYGGTNAHVILDAHNLSGSEVAHALENSSDANTRRRVFVFTANDETAARSLIKRMASYLRDVPGSIDTATLRDLAFTLSQRRSQLAYRLAVSASNARELADSLENGQSQFHKSLRTPRLGLVFTGQGAQSAEMGAGLLEEYPVFADSVHRASRTLKGLGCVWDLIGRRNPHKVHEGHLLMSGIQRNFSKIRTVASSTSLFTASPFAPHCKLRSLIYSDHGVCSQQQSPAIPVVKSLPHTRPAL